MWTKFDDKRLIPDKSPLTSSADKNYVVLYELGPEPPGYQDPKKKPELKATKQNEIIEKRIEQMIEDMEREDKEHTLFMKMMSDRSEEFRQEVQENLEKAKHVTNLSNDTICQLLEKNGTYLQQIYEGSILSARHEAFFKHGKENHDLLY